MEKWTEGEVREALARDDSEAIKEILKYVLERGDRVIRRGDQSLGMYADPVYEDQEQGT